MTDRELLILAARAINETIYAWSKRSDDDIKFADIGDKEVKPWNPLTRDEDALWLANELNMSVEVSSYEQATYAYAGKVPRVHACEMWGTRKSEATRRAIVRAAAQLGPLPVPPEQNK